MDPLCPRQRPGVATPARHPARLCTASAIVPVTRTRQPPNAHSHQALRYTHAHSIVQSFERPRGLNDTLSVLHGRKTGPERLNNKTRRGQFDGDWTNTQKPTSRPRDSGRSGTVPQAPFCFVICFLSSSSHLHLSAMPAANMQTLSRTYHSKDVIPKAAMTSQGCCPLPANSSQHCTTGVPPHCPLETDHPALSCWLLQALGAERVASAWRPAAASLAGRAPAEASAPTAETVPGAAGPACSPEPSFGRELVPSRRSCPGSARVPKACRVVSGPPGSLVPT